METLFRDKEVQNLYEFLVDENYLAMDGTPLKCPCCHQSEIQQTQTYYEQGDLVEFQEVCEHCQIPLGGWSYGHRESFLEYYEEWFPLKGCCSTSS